MHDYWHKQTVEQPLFPDLLWSRPENRAFAGKLAIIGGNAHGFAAPAEAYQAAAKAGIGVARVLLPDSLQHTVGRVFEAGEYAPSTPSGSFNQQALSELLDMSGWADGTLVAGDLGRNSETAILLEQFIAKYQGQLTLTKDSVNYLISTPVSILERPDTLLVLSFSQLQKLATAAHFGTAFTFDMDFIRIISALHEFTLKHKLTIITKHLETFFAAVSGQVSTTKLPADQPIWRERAAATAAVWWLQNPTKTFEALTSSCHTLLKA
jgi:ADP-dependent NAD(P)H-hydrate dehydratase / NAD(P)H-hydrate epimerase